MPSGQIIPLLGVTARFFEVIGTTLPENLALVVSIEVIDALHVPLLLILRNTSKEVPPSDTFKLIP